MVSLNSFSFPKSGDVSVCEKFGRVVVLPQELAEVAPSTQILASYPAINITRELFHHQTTRQVTAEPQDLLVPVAESLLKRFVRTFFERGSLVEALKVANREEYAKRHPIIYAASSYVLAVFAIGHRMRLLVHPQTETSIERFVQTRDWPTSPIRCLRWHPNCFKLAIAAYDDSIRIYTNKLGSVVPVLKSGAQKGVTCLVWRPWSPDELAVGCESGIILWTVDPSVSITPTHSQATHLQCGGHSPVTSLAWSPNGRLLASASINEADILIWDVDSQENTALKRIGAPAALLAWSPNGAALFSSTVSNIFRIWRTEEWSMERWHIAKGATVQSAVWSPCGNFLLFVTSEEPYLFSLALVDDKLFQHSSGPHQALPIADLSKVVIGTTEVGGLPQSLAWSPNGRYLAVTFKRTNAVAVFTVSTNKFLLHIAPSCFLPGLHDAEYPSCVEFQANADTILTIGWSTGRTQYFPFV